MRGFRILALVTVSGAMLSAAPTGRFLVVDDIVHDRRTNLLWQRTDDKELRTLTQAESFCADARFGHVDGWRVPSVMELQTLVDVREADPALDPVAFKDEPVQSYWTATPSAANPVQVGGQEVTMQWRVNFKEGTAIPVSTVGTMFVRCVR